MNISKIESIPTICNTQQEQPALGCFCLFFSVVVIGLKKCAALLPNYWLAEPPHPLFDVAWQTGGKGAGSEINCNVF
ncbi:hypothetical protein ABGT24_14445 [Peribacillus frigoritolerans]|uniref:hypothetical protein n=1 Tax=Peribacillus frigoritolerans TaxID=450367 RepID=UPI00345DF976